MIRENAEEDLIELGMLTDWLIKLLRIDLIWPCPCKTVPRNVAKIPFNW
jgi:hypothetical protein